MAAELTYYIGFTPSCNKDSYTTSILGAYSTKIEAETWLQKWLGTALEDMGALDLFKAETYIVDDELAEETDDESVPDLNFEYIQQYLFEDLNEVDYMNLVGHDFLCLNCVNQPSFWIVGTSGLPGEVRRKLERFLR